MAPTETLAAAEARVAAWAAPAQGGGAGDDDDDIIVGAAAASLRCPLSGMRVRRAARVTTSTAVAIFDLDAFLEVAERTRKWQDPTSCASFPCLPSQCGPGRPPSS